MIQKNENRIAVIRALYKKRKLIFIVSCATFLASIILSLLIPEHYRAYSTIMPPIEEDSFSNIASLMSDLPLQALGLGGASTGAETFMAILKSRSIMESAILRFDLVKKYKKKNIEATIKELRKKVGVTLDDEGTLTFFAEASTPWIPLTKKKKEEARFLSRDMTNYFIQELDRINRELRSERGRNTRIFIEKRYLQNLEDLRIAEDSLQAFQEKNGILYLPDQTRATIQAGAEIKAGILAKEIEYEMMKATMGFSNNEVKKVKQEIDAMKDKYNQTFYQRKSERQDDYNDLYLRYNVVPELGATYIRLFREVTLQEKLLEFILPQYEQAKIQEVKDTPSVQVLDDAVKPIKKHSPKRAIFVLFFTFIGFMGTCLYVVYKPYFHLIYKQMTSAA